MRLLKTIALCLVGLLLSPDAFFISIRDTFNIFMYNSNHVYYSCTLIHIQEFIYIYLLRIENSSLYVYFLCQFMWSFTNFTKVKHNHMSFYYEFLSGMSLNQRHTIIYNLMEITFWKIAFFLWLLAKKKEKNSS